MSPTISTNSSRITPSLPISFRDFPSIFFRSINDLTLDDNLPPAVVGSGARFSTTGCKCVFLANAFFLSISEGFVNSGNNTILSFC